MLFDFILIGAGPTAVAALTALPLGKKVLVATGANCRLGGSRTKSVHAKIASVARESGEEIGIGERISFAAPTKGELLRPAIVGGLANYWGQQFARYEANDPWPRKTFDSYEQYLQTCGKMEKLFDCSPGPDGGGMVPLDAGYSHRTPNLVLGCAGGRRLGLMSMRAAVQPSPKKTGRTSSHQSSISMASARPAIGGALPAQENAQRRSQSDADADGEHGEDHHRNRCRPGMIQEEAQLHRPAVLDRQTEQSDEYRDAQQPDKELEPGDHEWVR